MHALSFTRAVPLLGHPSDGHRVDCRHLHGFHEGFRGLHGHCHWQESFGGYSEICCCRWCKPSPRAAAASEPRWRTAGSRQRGRRASLHPPLTGLTLPADDPWGLAQSSESISGCKTRSPVIKRLRSSLREWRKEEGGRVRKAAGKKRKSGLTEINKEISRADRHVRVVRVQEIAEFHKDKYSIAKQCQLPEEAHPNEILAFPQKLLFSWLILVAQKWKKGKEEKEAKEPVARARRERAGSPACQTH